MLNIVLLILLWNSIMSKGKPNTLYCGLVGFSGKVDSNFNVDKLKTLLYWNQERGKDSLGFYTPGNSIIKELGKAEDVISGKDFNIPESNLFIGHVRAATVGDVNKDNAHPFNYGNIVLAMNGTLSNHWDLCRKNGWSVTDFEVDSQVLTALINRTQNKQPLTEIIGGCAVVYTDTNTNKLYCYRNTDRPLFRGKIGDTMYISSIEISLKFIGCIDVKEFKIDTLYEIENGNIKNTYKVKRAVEEAPVSSNLNVRELYTTLNFHQMHKSEFEGLWLSPKRTVQSLYYTFKMGYQYECLGVDPINSYEVIMMDHENRKVSVSMYSYFYEKQPIICARDYVFGLCNLTYSEKKDGKLGSKGDLYIVNEAFNDGYYSCKNLDTGKVGTIAKKYIRYATKIEATKYIDLFITPAVDVSLSELLNGVAVLTEDQIFRKEVELTEHDTLEKLCDFTMAEMLDLITDVEEVTKKPLILMKLINMQTLINNYTNKSINLIVK